MFEGSCGQSTTELGSAFLLSVSTMQRDSIPGVTQRLVFTHSGRGYSWQLKNQSPKP